MIRNWLPRVLMLLALAPAVSAFADGRVVDQTRQVPGSYAGVAVGGGIHVRVTPGSLGPVALRGEEAALAKVRLEIKDNTLHIGYEPHTSLDIQTPTLVTVTMPRAAHLGASGGSKLESSVPAEAELDLQASGGAELRLTHAIQTRKLDVAASGAGRVTVPTVETSEAEISLSGAATLSISGRAESVRAQLAGAAGLDAANLRAGTVEVNGSGGVQAAIRAARAEGSISGGSRLRIPAAAEARVNASGGSQVTRDL